MLIWSGWGILVLIITFIVAFFMDGISKSTGINSDLTFALGLIFSGLICWFLGKRLNRPSDKIYINKETGEEVREKNGKHRLFFIKMEYWAPVLIFFGIIGITTLFK